MQITSRSVQVNPSMGNRVFLTLLAFSMNSDLEEIVEAGINYNISTL